MLDLTPAALAATLGGIALLFTVDLWSSWRRLHAVGFREAVAQSVFYVSVADRYDGGGWSRASAAGGC